MRDLIFDNPWPLIHECYKDILSEFIPRKVFRYREFQTVAGPCDLLLVWRHGACIVEMKRDVIDEGAVSQCLRYIGAFENQNPGIYATGIVCAPSITSGAKYAISAADQRIDFYRFSATYSVALEKLSEPPSTGYSNHAEELLRIYNPERFEQRSPHLALQEARDIVVAAAGESEEAIQPEENSPTVVPGNG